MQTLNGNLTKENLARDVRKHDRQPLTVVLGFDMETDIGSWTPYYEGLKHGTPRMLQIMADQGVSSTCYFVGQAAKDHPEIVRDVQAAGHEIGCHGLYHETLGDSILPIPGQYGLLPHEVEPRLKLATEWVAEATGTQPRSFRCPRLFGSTHVCNALESLGYISDATYPLYFYGERLTPYHPSSNDWTQPGDMKLIEIPNFADLSIESTDSYGRDRDQWPLFRTESAAAVASHIDGFLEYCRTRDVAPVLCFYFHPWEFWPMLEGPIHYGEGAVCPDPFIIKNCGEYAVEQLGAVISALKARGARFLTAAECALEWSSKSQSQGHEPMLQVA
jgi:peptidoglycan/xylan/chitin deacetylase (PgdA/CDA1 family)